MTAACSQKFSYLNILKYISPSVYVFLNWKGPDDQLVYKQALVSQFLLIQLNFEALFM